ncbi:uncharacterized [Tachysurus ichikawai]
MAGSQTSPAVLGSPPYELPVKRTCQPEVKCLAASDLRQHCWKRRGLAAHSWARVCFSGPTHPLTFSVCLKLDDRREGRDVRLITPQACENTVFF